MNNKKEQSLKPAVTVPGVVKSAGAAAHPFSSLKYVPTAIFVLFALIIGFGMHVHELWRDELEIYSRLAFTNHVLLEGDISSIFYYVFLKCFMLINSSEAMFQIAHWVIVVTAMLLFIKNAAISNLQKLLFALSYFIVYDYGIISRYYGFMILLLFVLISLLTKREKNYLLIAAMLLVLANHSIQSTIFAGCLSIYLLFDILSLYRRGKLHFSASFLSALIVFIVGWVAILVSHYFVTLQNASYLGNGQFGSAPLFMTIKSLWNAFFPVPNFNAGAAFWNTNIVPYTIIYPPTLPASSYATIPNMLAFLVSVFVLIVMIAKFSERPAVCLTFCLTTLVYLAFLQYTKVYFLRYQGLLFLIFMYHYWLFKNTEGIESLKILEFIDGLFRNKSLRFLKKCFNPVLYTILAAQVFSGYYAFSTDVKYKFTMSQDAAEYIVLNNLDKTHLMVGYIDYAAQTIAAHTKTKMFFPQVDHFGYYQEPFNKARKRTMQLSDIFASCRSFTEKQDRKVLLVLNFPLSDKSGQIISAKIISQNLQLRLVRSFTGEIIQPDEQFWLYEVAKLNDI